MQFLYSFLTSNGELKKQQAEENLEKSLNNLYALYLYLLTFLAELGKYVGQYNEKVKARSIPGSEDQRALLRLCQNPLMQVLTESKALHNKREWYKVQWAGDTELLRKVFLDLKNSEIYQDYTHTRDQQIFEDYEILNYILKHYPVNFSLLTQHLEDQFFNWHDDKKLAIQMTSKTLKKIASEPSNTEFLLPVSVNEKENFQFSKELFKLTIEHNEELEKLILKKVTKWEPKQISRVDYIILKMGLCEFLYFPTIPIKVTLNEYIELAKNYSSPNSKKFINGVLDKILSELKNQGKLVKTDRGLYEG